MSSKQKKYLIFGDGQSTHTLKWAKELTKYFDLYLLSFSTFKTEFYELFEKEKLIELGLTINSNGGNYHSLLVTPKIYKIIRTINPVIINAHYLSSYGLVGALLKKYYGLDGKLVISTWGTDVLVTPFKSRIHLGLTKFVLRMADIITSDSYYMSDVIKNISKRSSVTFPFGIEEFPEKIFINDKIPTMIFSNRALYPNYKIDEVIIFFSQLAMNNSNMKLIIANQGPEQDTLKKLVKSLNLEDKVQFTGFLSNLAQAEFYKKSQFFISIPESDATSVSLLEAMAYGCIPIVSNIPANREWIINGVNGFYYENRKVPGFEINKIEEYREDFFLLNRKIIESKAIWENNCRYYINVLGETNE